jgi:hypothetical protein
LHRGAGLLLNDGCPVANGAAADQIADTQLHEVAPTLFAINGKVEQGPITQSPVLIEIETDGPDVARPERTLRSDILPSVPGAPFMHGGVKIGMSHSASPAVEVTGKSIRLLRNPPLML